MLTTQAGHERANVWPLVTIIVIGYQHDRYIIQCLESVRNQTVPVDLIVVDDASGDTTQQVVRNWLNAHPEQPARTVFHQVNRGLTPSLNEALSMITTPYFAYIAADDWMVPQRSQVQVSLLENAGTSTVLAYSDALRANERGELFGATFAETHPDVWEGASESDTFAALLKMNWIPAPTVMLRTEAVRAIGGYDPGIFYEDHDMYLRLARHYDFVCSTEALAVHRESDESYGHRMFFTDEGRRSFQRAQVDILVKHLEAEQVMKSDVVDRLTKRIVYLYRSGEPPAWIAPRARLLRSHSPTLALRLVLLASRLGIAAPRPRRFVADLTKRARVWLKR